MAYELVIERGIPCTVVDPASIRLSDYKTKRLFGLCARQVPLPPIPEHLAEHLARAQSWMDHKVCAAYGSHAPDAAYYLVSRGLNAVGEEFAIDFAARHPRLWHDVDVLVGMHPDQVILVHDELM